ncbi:MAG: MATE family efflux transporter [DPANN group archaeon]|nr:MATE family efflux transporter [DPANN group archaeon]
MKKQKKAILTKGPVGKTIVNMTLAMMIGMVGMVAFNIVDTFFIGQLGINELAALSFTFPVIMVVVSVSLGIGIGASAVISKAIGNGDENTVKRLTTDTLILSFLLTIIFVIIGLLTTELLFGLLGADPTILPLVKEYMNIWYIGVLFVIVPMVGNSAIRATGDMKTPSMIMLVAVIANVILDPLLIFGIGPFPRLEIAGAAIATVIARAVTLIFALWVLHYRENMICFKIPSFKHMVESWKQILYIGIPVSLTRMIVPVALGVATSIIATYGTKAVAAFGVATRIEFFALAALMALSSVLGPFVGQNWASKKKERVSKGISYSNRLSLFWGVLMVAVLGLIGGPIAGIFSSDPEVISTIVMFLYILPVSYAFYGVFMISTMTLNVLNKPMIAAALTVFQMFILYVPLVYIGSYMFEIQGIFIGMSIAYIVSGVVGYFVLRKFLVGKKVSY